MLLRYATPFNHCCIVSTSKNYARIRTIRTLKTVSRKQRTKHRSTRVIQGRAQESPDSSRKNPDNHGECHQATRTYRHNNQLYLAINISCLVLMGGFFIFLSIFESVSSGLIIGNDRPFFASAGAAGSQLHFGTDSVWQVTMRT